MSILGPEGYPQIPRHRDCVVAFVFARQSVQPEPRYIHIPWHSALIQHCKDMCHLSYVLWSHTVRTLASVE